MQERRRFHFALYQLIITTGRSTEAIFAVIRQGRTVKGLGKYKSLWGLSWGQRGLPLPHNTPAAAFGVPQDVPRPSVDGIVQLTQ